MKTVDVLRFGSAVALLAVLQPAAENTSGLARSSGQRSDVRALPTRPQFATYQYGIAVRVPPGLFYCPMPKDWIGADHGRSIYLVRPEQCDEEAGYVLGPGGGDLPRIDLFYGYNVAEADYPDGSRPARTAAELTRQDCKQPHQLADVMLLGQPAIACELRPGGEIEIEVGTPYDLEKRGPDGIPDAMMTIQLITTPQRLASDRPKFNSFVGSIYQCAAQWGSDEKSAKSFWVGAAPGRPECPPDAFW